MCQVILASCYGLNGKKLYSLLFQFIRSAGAGVRQRAAGLQEDHRPDMPGTRATHTATLTTDTFNSIHITRF